ncbi:MAG: M23 family metallopeptidase [Actinomycetota bacterium]|nr:M23 family metallopeptidase [Actinomycetota bacterium]
MAPAPRPRLALFVATTCAALTLASCGGGGARGSPVLDFMRFPDPATSPYCLPYPIGESARVTQTWSDTGTHRGRFAIDFARPVGSEVTAARGGEVTETRARYRDDDPTGGHENGVYVLHEDGTMAAYLHFSEDGVVVDVGDDVVTGQALGLIGTSGTNGAPHLHVEVFEGQGEASQWYRSLPISFANAPAPLDAWGGLSHTGYESLPCEPATR